MTSRLVGGYALAAAVALLAGFGAARWFTVAEDVPALLDLPVVDLDGRTHTLALWQGQLTLVNFWATWCAPCREEIPVFMAVQGEWSARGLHIIG
ncbi:MAG: TlpA family protein disulfide reductase, partial [Gammaproteobacteria bacterium]|nr:TlpA family protein disulfide reductase [Gammaproteobacteria bacterium]